AGWIELRDGGVEAGEGRFVSTAREEACEGGDLHERGRRFLLHRNRQLLHRRRSDVRRDAQAHEVVEDEAVEETAEKIVGTRRQRRAQTEDGVRRDAVRRQDGGNQRQ